MSIIRSVVSFQGVSNLPEDVFQNVWHFIDNDVEAPSLVYSDIAAALSKFYGVAPVSGAAALTSYMAGDALSSAAPTVEHYRVGTGGVTGSPDGFSNLLGMAAYSTGTALPSELAICLSFHGDLTDIPEDVPGGPAGPAGDLKLAARRRGRIYFGPLDTGVLAGGTSPGLVTINTEISIRNAAQELVDSASLDADGVHWAVYSRKADTAYPVVGGWVDNAFDVQRRRGIAATGRAPFTAT